MKPDAQQQPADYRGDIDGLRAVAVLSVMIYHLSANWLPGGFVGVDVFFVISGFVVSASLAHAPTDRFRHFVAFFYARRLARIGPALVLVLLATAMAATLLIPRAWLSEFNEKTGLHAFFGLSNWVLQHNADSYFAPRAEFNPYTHAWSLGVEEQFYLLFPFLFFAWVKLRANPLHRKLATAFLAMCGLASLAACVVATKAAPAMAFYSIQCRFWELAVGVLLYQLSTPVGHEDSLTGGGRASPPTRALPWLGAIAIGLSFALARASEFPWFWAVPPVLGAACIIGRFGADTQHPLRRGLALAPLVWVGKRSYSLYLWHWPVFVVLRWTLGLDDIATRIAAVALALVLAAASYRWVELPFRHSAGLLRRAPVVRIAVLLALIVAGWGVTRLIFTQQKSLGLSTVSRHADEWYVSSQMPPGLLDAATFPRRCTVAIQHRALAGGQVISFAPGPCGKTADVPPTAPGGVAARLSVIGDSHATAYLPMFDQLSAETGMTVSVYTYPGCAFLDLRLPMNVGRGPDCVAFTQAATQDVVKSARAGDVLFLASLRQPRFADQWAAFNATDVLAATQSELARTWLKQARDEAGTLLQPFVSAGLTVLIDAPKPVFRAPTFRCADRFNATNPVCAGGLSQPRNELESLRSPVLENIRALSAQVPAVRVWDPFPLLCPGATCTPFDGVHPLFFDGDHLSAYGNAYLYPAFRDVIHSLGRR